MPGRIVARRFEILGYLGGGRFGTVWAVFDHNLGRECALKVFHPGTQVFQAFYEAQILVALQGPYILQVYDADSYMDVPWIATVRALGSAHDHMGVFGVNPGTAIRWTRDALVGLEVAHSRNLLHRDIKPGNLFLESPTRALLGDFGVAALMDSNGQAPPHGDPLVRAPEMITAGTADIRSDIYSMGVTLYTLLTGRYPFERGDPSDLRDAIVAADCPRLEDLAPHVPARLVRTVRAAMNIDPRGRFATAEEMSLDLSRVPALSVTWTRIAPHEGHDACWLGTRIGRADGFEVCVDQGMTRIMTRRTPSSRRIGGLCVTSRRSRIFGELRRVLRGLG